MMSLTFNDIYQMATLLLGGAGVSAFFTWKYVKREAKAKAEIEEVNMAQKVQDTYQEILDDKDKTAADNRRLIQELREDRDHFRNMYMEVRNRQDKTDETVRQLQEQVARNGRMVKSMRPFLCADLTCKHRQSVVLPDMDGRTDETT